MGRREEVHKQLFLHSTEILKSCYLFPGRQTFFATTSVMSLTFPPRGAPAPCSNRAPQCELQYALHLHW